MKTCAALLSFGSALFACLMLSTPTVALHVAVPSRPPSSAARPRAEVVRSSPLLTFSTPKGAQPLQRSTRLHMSSMDQESNSEEQKKKEELWRVVLHRDEVHTYNYVVRSLTKVIGNLDRKTAFEICIQMHRGDKVTVTKTGKRLAEHFCLGLQRQGLTASISPDEDLDNRLVLP